MQKMVYERYNNESERSERSIYYKLTELCRQLISTICRFRKKCTN